MNSAHFYRLSTLVCVFASLAPRASAADFSFSGTFLADDNSVVITFTLNSTSTVTGLTSLCNLIQSNGSGYGICKGCQAGALKGAKQ